MQLRIGKSITFINLNYVREVCVPDDEKSDGTIFWHDGDSLNAPKEECLKVGAFINLMTCPQFIVEQNK